MNYAQAAQRYWDLAEAEEIAAGERKDQVYRQEESRLMHMRQWNPALRSNSEFAAYAAIRGKAALEKDDEYNSHISMQQHYLRKAHAATAMAQLHGQTLYVYEEEEEGP